MKVRKILCCFIFGWIITPVTAQNSTPRLEKIWKKVQADYVGVQVKTTNIKAALAEEKSIRGKALPQLHLQAQNTYGSYRGIAGAFFPQTGIFNIAGTTTSIGSPSIAPNFYTSATLDWTLYNFGRWRKENQAAQMKTEVTKASKSNYLLTLKHDLSSRFLHFLWSKEMLKWNQENIHRLDKIREVTAALTASGLKTSADSLLALSSYTQAQGKNAYYQGLTASTVFRLQELFPLFRSEDKNESKYFLSPQQKLVSISDTHQLQAHPHLLLLQQKATYFDLKAQAKKRSALPKLKLLGGYSFRGTGIYPNGQVKAHWNESFANNVNNYIVGLGVTWNVSDLFSQRNKGNALALQAQSKHYAYLQEKGTLQTKLLALQRKISHAFLQLQKDKQALQQVREAYNMYLARYKSGIIALTELLQVEGLLVIAEKQQLNTAQYYWQQAIALAVLTTDFTYLFTHL